MSCFRVSADEVRAVLGTIPSAANADLDPSIEAANSLVTRLLDLTPAIHTPATLALIEKWLAADAFASSPGGAGKEGSAVLRERIDVAEVWFAGISSREGGLGSSMYGVWALRLDTSGVLARWNNTVTKAVNRAKRVTWLGRTNC